MDPGMRPSDLRIQLPFSVLTSCDVVDGEAERDGDHVALALHVEPDLGACDAQPPKAFTVAINEAPERVLDLLRLENKRRDEVDKQVVAIRIFMLLTHNLEGIQNVREQTVGLGDEIVGRADRVLDATRTNKGANEEAAVGWVLLGNGIVDVDVAVLDEARDATEVALAQLDRVGLYKFIELGLPVVVVQSILAADGDIENVTHAVLVVLSDQPVRAWERGVAEGLENAVKINLELLDRVQCGHGARADRLLICLIEQESKVGDRSDALSTLVEAASSVVQEKLPRDDEGCNVHVVVDSEDLVSVVRTARVHLECGQTDPVVIVVEKVGQNVKDVELGIHQVLDGIEARRTVLGAATVNLLCHGRDKNLLHLAQSLLVRGHLAMNE
ncbi:hypothetical protein BC937DRAFT_90265 [Endogone sp. FLAS-F59071]|nr:hypothetical protein BC937DRAFT_90265 [Endogone sp. FLAS-F59071]|eukprot:RUS22133.1 hypothetical protein BC937DRAFT_90265 [Endogone sp. FLAS-F59071]